MTLLPETALQCLVTKAEARRDIDVEDYVLERKLTSGESKNLLTAGILIFIKLFNFCSSESHTARKEPFVLSIISTDSLRTNDTPIKALKADNSRTETLSSRRVVKSSGPQSAIICTALYGCVAEVEDLVLRYLFDL